MRDAVIGYSQMSCPTTAHTTTAFCFDQHYKAIERLCFICLVNTEKKEPKTQQQETQLIKFGKSWKVTAEKPLTNRIKATHLLCNAKKLGEKNSGYFLFKNIAMKVTYFKKWEYFRFAAWHIDDAVHLWSLPEETCRSTEYRFGFSSETKCKLHCVSLGSLFERKDLINKNVIS